MKNQFLIDFLTINVRYYDPDTVFQAFLDSIENPEVCADNFEFVSRGVMRGYDSSFRFLSQNFLTLNWAQNYPANGVSLNLTGQGCAFLSLDDMVRFVKKLDELEKSYFENCQKLGKKPDYVRIYNVTRLDAALDDFERVIPVSEMLESARDFV